MSPALYQLSYLANEPTSGYFIKFCLRSSIAPGEISRNRARWRENVRWNQTNSGQMSRFTRTKSIVTRRPRMASSTIRTLRKTFQRSGTHDAS